MMSNSKAITNEPTVINHIVIVVTAFLASSFILYAILNFVKLVSSKLGFPYVYSYPGTSIETLLSFFLICLLGSLFYFFLFIGWVSNFRLKRQTPEKLPLVSIIIPAFNEQETVCKSIDCALDQNYPEFEVIVVDDGSSDLTPFLINHPEVKTISLSQNQGKSKAVNSAIGEAKGEYILFSDSDSHLHPDAIKQLIGHFNDPQVGAVSGQILVRKKSGLVVLWQTVEYIFGQAIVKVAQCGSGSSITVCPGPISMYRRQILLSLGGFKERTIVEDFDLTLEVIEAGNKVIYEPRALSWTSTPKTFTSLKQQRVRWYRGNLQVFQIYKNMYFNRKFGTLGFFWMPYLLFLGVGGVLLEAALYLCLPFIIYFSAAPVEAALFLVFLYVVFEIVNIIQYILVLALNNNLRFSLIIAACTMKPYQLFLFWTRLISLYREIRQDTIIWNG